MKECVATAKFMIEKRITVHIKRAYIYIMHQSFVFPAALGLGVPGTKQGLSTEIWPTMCPRSAVDVRGGGG